MVKKSFICLLLFSVTDLFGGDNEIRFLRPVFEGRTLEEIFRVKVDFQGVLRTFQWIIAPDVYVTFQKSEVVMCDEKGSNGCEGVREKFNSLVDLIRDGNYKFQQEERRSGQGARAVKSEELSVSARGQDHLVQKNIMRRVSDRGENWRNSRYHWYNVSRDSQCKIEAKNSVNFYVKYIRIKNSNGIFDYWQLLNPLINANGEVKCTYVLMDTSSNSLKDRDGRSLQGYVLDRNHVLCKLTIQENKFFLDKEEASSIVKEKLEKGIPFLSRMIDFSRM